MAIKIFSKMYFSLEQMIILSSKEKVIVSFGQRILKNWK
jgi:hypothetical protein